MILCLSDLTNLLPSDSMKDPSPSFRYSMLILKPKIRRVLLFSDFSKFSLILYQTKNKVL